MSKTRRRLVTVFTVIGMITTGFMLLGVMAVTCTCVTRDEVAPKTVLELHLDRRLGVEGAEDPLASVLGAGGPTAQQVLAALHRAADDDRVVGVVAHIDGTSHGMAVVEELREAVLAFRATGKPAIAFSETFGELGPGNQGYYLATAFDEIHLQPTGGLGLTGLRSERMYLRGAFDKLDIEPEGGQRSEYKSAYDRYTARRMSDADREQTTVLLADMHEQLVAALAPRFDDDAQRAREVIEQGPYLAGEAKELGLVDSLSYRDGMLSRLEEQVGEDAERLYAGPYLERAGGPWDEGQVIAVIYGAGGISRGPSAFDPIEGYSILGAETIIAAFEAAIDDPEVEAIVFRVDSPGGSAVASDAIWRVTQRAKEAGKPVIISMGNYAASGGYYVSAGATKIVALPSTLTGSIGVLSVKMVTRGIWNKLGVTYDSVQTSNNAAFWTANEGYDAEGRARLDAWLDQVYADFKQRVAEGRGLTPEQVEELARGRVWSGKRAKELGLVDELGGMTKAIELARAAAEIDEDASIELRRFPQSKSLVERLLGGGPSNSDKVAARVRVDAGLEQWRRVAASVRAIQMGSGDAGVLTVSPLTVE
ncbi:MAG: signal peptide peptidase SppA [Myxococcota bacterium]